MVIESAWLDNLQIHKAGGLAITDMSLGSPAPRAVVENRPGDHGAVDSTRFYGPRTIELTGYVGASTHPEFIGRVDNLLGRLALGSVHVLRFRRLGDTNDLRCMVRVDSGVDMSAGEHPSPFARWGVSLFCADPRLYSDTLTVASYDPTDAGSDGLVFPLGFPLVFGAEDGVGVLTVENAGTVSTPPVLTVTGPVTNPTIDNETLGLSIRTQNCGLASGDTLVVDVAERVVRLNGTTSRPDLVDTARTHWWELAPGPNRLRMRGSGMVSAETELEVSFRSAHI